MPPAMAQVVSRRSPRPRTVRHIVPHSHSGCCATHHRAKAPCPRTCGRPLPSALHRQVGRAALWQGASLLPPAASARPAQSGDRLSKPGRHSSPRRWRSRRPGRVGVAVTSALGSAPAPPVQVVQAVRPASPPCFPIEPIPENTRPAATANGVPSPMARRIHARYRRSRGARSR